MLQITYYKKTVPTKNVYKHQNGYFLWKCIACFDLWIYDVLCESMCIIGTHLFMKYPTTFRVRLVTFTSKPVTD